MLKIIQAIRNTIEAIPIDELENEEEELKRVQVHLHMQDIFGIPDPLEEEDEQILRKLLQTEASFEEIRKFVEYVRCKDLEIFGVDGIRGGPPNELLFIRGRIFEFITPIDLAARGEEEKLKELKQDKLKREELKREQT